MEKFSKTLHGYNPEEVNQFIDNIITQTERVINLSKKQDTKIKELESIISDLKDKLSRYEGMDETLRHAIMMAQKTSEQMKLNTIKESEFILEEAKRNADRIVNDALIKADTIEREAEMLRKNAVLFKRKLKDQLQLQMDMIDDIEKFDY
nr:DivIVA domain-containing protein [Bacilli bacterium]